MRSTTFGFIMFDPMYFLHVGPAILLALWAQANVKCTFQLVNLPVQFHASRRAHQILLSDRTMTDDEDKIVGKVLSATALTCVAVTLTAILTLLYHVSPVSGRCD